jgi:hypothetical protein
MTANPPNMAIPTWFVGGLGARVAAPVTDALLERCIGEGMVPTLLAQTSPLGLARSVPPGVTLATHAPGCAHCVGSLPFRTALTGVLRTLANKPPNAGFPVALVLEQTVDSHFGEVLANLRKPPFDGHLRLAASIVVVAETALVQTDAQARARLAEVLDHADWAISDSPAAQPLLHALMAEFAFTHVKPLEFVNLASILRV